MIKCPLCNNELVAGIWRCEACGYELMCCADCGKISSSSSCLFCNGEMVPVHAYVAANAGVAPHEDNCGNVSTPKYYLANETLDMKLPMVDGVIIGRKKGPYAVFFIDYIYVSGGHAMLKKQRQSDDWIITDLNSSNGTMVNGQTVRPGKDVKIKEGDRIQLANVELIVKKE